ncbi:hypothetical protein J6590_087986 [Homalodisca vitripennis]|nr:hypothetical protein J6590_087986 [Homalodisca vitripennis]
MADDTKNLNNSAFGEDVSEKKLAFREKQKKARLSGKSYMTLNKHTRKEIAAKPFPAVEVSVIALPVVMELEKVFPLPKLTHCKMYYLRQLTCYNFNVHSTNANDAIVCMLHEGQSVKGIFESVQHKFLLSGHSFSVADRDFAIIEKKCRSARMQVMEDLQKVIEEARPSKPFKVLKMADHFFDFDKAASSCIDTKKTRHQSDFRDQSGSN